MKQKEPKIRFRISVETEDHTGDVLAVYFQFREGKHDHVMEFDDGAAIADYDSHGRLLGVEILAPCNVKIVDKMAANEPVSLRTDVKRFMRKSGPRALVAAR